MKRNWFRKRRGLFSRDLGWGWIPTNWRGWVVIIIFLCLVGFDYFLFNMSNPSIGQATGFLIVLFALMFIAAYISSKKTKK